MAAPSGVADDDATRSVLRSSPALRSSDLEITCFTSSNFSRRAVFVRRPD